MNDIKQYINLVNEFNNPIITEKAVTHVLSKSFSTVMSKLLPKSTPTFYTTAKIKTMHTRQIANNGLETLNILEKGNTKEIGALLKRKSADDIHQEVISLRRQASLNPAGIYKTKDAELLNAYRLKIKNHVPPPKSGGTKQKADKTATPANSPQPPATVQPMPGTSTANLPAKTTPKPATGATDGATTAARPKAGDASASTPPITNLPDRFIHTGEFIPSARAIDIATRNINRLDYIDAPVRAAALRAYKTGGKSKLIDFINKNKKWFVAGLAAAGISMTGFLYSFEDDETAAESPGADGHTAKTDQPTPHPADSVPSQHKPAPPIRSTHSTSASSTTLGEFWPFDNEKNAKEFIDLYNKLGSYLKANSQDNNARRLRHELKVALQNTNIINHAMFKMNHAPTVSI